MTAVHPDAELAPRDVVARGIAAAVRDQGGAPVLLDATGLGADFLTGRFPGLTRATRAAGFDWTRQGVPVSPAAHYSMGGIATDAEGRTSLPGLLAIGEAACTGVHGANRLASNSLLEGLVFAVRAADAVAGTRPGLLRLRGNADLRVTSVPRAADVIRASRQALPGGATHLDDVGAVRQAVQAVMTDRVGLLRDATGLASARRDLDALTAPATGGVREHEDRALLDLARLVALAAETRTESRGAHARTDHPDTDPAAPAPYAWVAETVTRHIAVPQEVPA
jgi:L-aspartate oxidase